MNAITFARIALVCAASLVASTGAHAAKGNLSVGLTIVSSCAVSGADLIRAASPSAAVVAGCGNGASYTVSVAAAKADAATGSREEAAAGAGNVVVTLTY